MVWLGGFRSDMTRDQGPGPGGLGGGARAGPSCGSTISATAPSSGDFLEGTISRWRDDALAVLDDLVEGPAVLVGSSMGGWIACLLALARPARVKALVLIAPAADFTEKLVWPGLTAEQRAMVEEEGRLGAALALRAEGLPFTRALIQDGALWSILPGPVEITAPRAHPAGRPRRRRPLAPRLKLAQAIAGEDRGVHPDQGRRPPPLPPAGSGPDAGGGGGDGGHPIDVIPAVAKRRAGTHPAASKLGPRIAPYEPG